MKIEIFPKTPNENVREYVYRLIRENILNLTLCPGSEISEPETALKLKVSRTPVREAFIRLAEDRLLDIRPQRGTTVTLLNLSLISEAIFVRSTLECEVLKLACGSIDDSTLAELELNLLNQAAILAGNFEAIRFFRLDNDFHRTLFVTTSHGYAWEFLDRCNSHHQRLRVYEMQSASYLQNIYDQHCAIFAALKQKDDSRISAIVHKHLWNFLPHFESLRKNHPEYFAD